MLILEQITANLIIRHLLCVHIGGGCGVWGVKLNFAFHNPTIVVMVSQECWNTEK